MPDLPSKTILQLGLISFVLLLGMAVITAYVPESNPNGGNASLVPENGPTTEPEQVRAPDLEVARRSSNAESGAVLSGLAGLFNEVLKRFKENSAMITPEMGPYCTRIVELLAEFPSGTLQVELFTNPPSLAEKRAHNLQNFLQRRGLPADRLRISGLEGQERISIYIVD